MMYGRSSRQPEQTQERISCSSGEAKEPQNPRIFVFFHAGWRKRPRRRAPSKKWPRRRLRPRKRRRLLRPRRKGEGPRSSGGFFVHDHAESRRRRGRPRSSRWRRRVAAGRHRDEAKKATASSRRPKKAAAAYGCTDSPNGHGDHGALLEMTRSGRGERRFPGENEQMRPWKLDTKNSHIALPLRYYSNDRRCGLA